MTTTSTVQHCDREAYEDLMSDEYYDDPVAGWEHFMRHREAATAPLIELLRETMRVVGICQYAIDVADRLIERGYGMDTPDEWHAAFKTVADARATLAKIDKALTP